ncbi:MAG: hypothetical protein ACLQDV_21480 [Candidatus Binataceae bacterium]
MAERDYVRSLRSRISYRELIEIVAAGSKVWPKLNRAQMRPLPANGFEQAVSPVISKLRIHLKIAPYQGPGGLALRGFYLEKREGLLRQPLIYVNSAHIPVVMTSTFFHEVGHHLTSQVFEKQRDGVHFFFDADYASHLNDPMELGADVLASLAGYPSRVARKLFEVPWNWGLAAKTGNLTEEVFANVHEHVQRHFRFNLHAANLPAAQRLNYLAGIIHYAKLRWALLAEYDI